MASWHVSHLGTSSNANDLPLPCFSSSAFSLICACYEPSQRGPVLPCSEELSEPSDEKGTVTAAGALLALPLLVLAPYPIELMMAISELGNATF